MKLWLLFVSCAALCSEPSDWIGLPGFSTELLSRSNNQRHNIALAASRLDGLIIPPGKTFSMAKHIGECSSQKGYKVALAYFGGEVVADYGGGVCQVSSTLYVAALQAGLCITERRRHTWPVKSVPPGLDAAYAAGSPDLKLANPFSYPLRLSLKIVGRRLEARFESPQSPEFTSRIERRVTCLIPFSTVTKLSREVSRRTVLEGRAGQRVQVWRHTYKGDNKVSSELISTDVYEPVNRLILLPAR
jgi:vancomycin resistance protein YoaR